jgi:hypothetical protein
MFPHHRGANQRRSSAGAKAESVPKGFGTDPLNLLQVMLAKGSHSAETPRNRLLKV